MEKNKTMESIAAIEDKLCRLRQKWLGNIPKDFNDPRWWAFRRDKCIAIRLKAQIEKLNGKIDDKREENLYQTAKELFR